MIIILRLKHKIYPPELDITTDDENDQNVHYLDLDILIKNDQFSYCIYDKRDKFNFPIVNFPTVNFPNLSGSIPTGHSYCFFCPNSSGMLEVAYILRIFKRGQVL